MDGMFEKWYDKIEEEDSMEDRRKVVYSPQHKSAVMSKQGKLLAKCGGNAF